MKIPPDAIIVQEKLTLYLLVPREYDDKSKFLSLAGFTQDNPQQLIEAIWQLVESDEATEDRNSEYGIFYRVEGDITGPNGRTLSITTIWLQWHSDGRFRFVTLIRAN